VTARQLDIDAVIPIKKIIKKLPFSFPKLFQNKFKSLRRKKIIPIKIKSKKS